MFIPVYKWTWHTNSNNTEQPIFPLYSNSLQKVWEKSDGRKFFRHKLDGKIKFLNSDFDTFDAMPVDTKFFITLYISYDKAQTWETYQECYWYKTDGEWNYDDKIVTVSLQSVDEYEQILSGIDNEYNLIKLAPDLQALQYKQRAIMQMYSIGEETCGMFIDTLYWETPCKDVASATPQRLVNNDGWAYLNSPAQVTINISNLVSPNLTMRPTINTTYHSISNNNVTGKAYYGEMRSENDDYYIVIRNIPRLPATLGWRYVVQVYDSIDNSPVLFGDIVISASDYDTWRIDKSYTFPKVWIGNYTQDKASLSERYDAMTIDTQFVYARILTANATYGTEIAEDDAVGSPSTYKYRYTPNANLENLVIFSAEVQDEATEYGQNTDGKYWVKPNRTDIVPIARNSWSFCSIWGVFSDISVLDINRTLKDAYTLGSCIKVLLSQFATDVTFDETADYSQFLYGSTFVRNDSFDLFLTQKSNILVSEYDKPAEKAPCTLGKILTMLENTFRLFWFVENGKLRIEHEYFFRNGGSYDVIPTIGTDLTRQSNLRNGKPYDFGQNKITYDKPNMPERYEFSWNEDATQAFAGLPIEVLSGFVNKGQIKQISVSGFSADIDYGMANAEYVSLDGFYVLSAISNEVPIVERQVEGVMYKMQNGYLAFCDLQPKYWLYDMPAPRLKVNALETTAIGVARNKTQEVRFPALYDIQMEKLIKTMLGNSNVEKCSINLETRTAIVELKHDMQ